MVWKAAFGGLAGAERRAAMGRFFWDLGEEWLADILEALDHADLLAGTFAGRTFIKRTFAKWESKAAEEGNAMVEAASGEAANPAKDGEA